MIGDDFDKAAEDQGRLRANAAVLAALLNKSRETVDTKQALAVIAMGVDANMRLDQDDNTLLIQAGFAGNSEVICALLQNGADPRLANKRGETPLHFAAKALLPDAVTALLKHGADIYARDEFKKTAEEHTQNIFGGGLDTPVIKEQVLTILRDATQHRIKKDMDAALLREEVQNFTGSGCATKSTVKPMKRLQIKPQGTE